MEQNFPAGGLARRGRPGLGYGAMGGGGLPEDPELADFVREFKRRKRLFSVVFGLFGVCAAPLVAARLLRVFLGRAEENRIIAVVLPFAALAGLALAAVSLFYAHCPSCSRFLGPSSSPRCSREKDCEEWLG